VCVYFYVVCFAELHLLSSFNLRVTFLCWTFLETNVTDRFTVRMYIYQVIFVSPRQFVLYMVCREFRPNSAAFVQRICAFDTVTLKREIINNR
jgi:hypothetical protein